MDVIFLGTNGWYDSDTGNTICTLINSSKVPHHPRRWQRHLQGRSLHPGRPAGLPLPQPLPPGPHRGPAHPQQVPFLTGPEDLRPEGDQGGLEYDHQRAFHSSPGQAALPCRGGRALPGLTRCPLPWSASFWCMPRPAWATASIWTARP